MGFASKLESIEERAAELFHLFSSESLVECAGLSWTESVRLRREFTDQFNLLKNELEQLVSSAKKIPHKSIDQTLEINNSKKTIANLKCQLADANITIKQFDNRIAALQVAIREKDYLIASLRRSFRQRAKLTRKSAKRGTAQRKIQTTSSQRSE